jgi:hypothetical protein
VSAVADWFADATGRWLGIAVTLVWASQDAVHNPTLLLPYDRCFLNAGMALAICRMIYRDTGGDQWPAS